MNGRGAAIETLVGLVATALVLGACRSDGPRTSECSPGTERCACYGNHTCNSGLTCASDLCVSVGGAAGAGQAGGESPAGTGGRAVDVGEGGSPNTGLGGTAGAAAAATSGGVAVGSGGAEQSTGGVHSTGGSSPGGGAAGSAAGGGAAGGEATGGSSASGASGPSASGAGGAAGSGASQGLIDDFEQNANGELPQWEGRAGCWYTFNDGAGTTQTPVPLPTGSICSFPYSTPGHASDNAVRTYGEATSGGWAGMGFDLDCPSNNAAQKQPYDALGRGYGGLTFWARLGDTAGAATTVRLTLPDRYTDPAGGVCTTCNDNWYVPILLTSAWQKYSIHWTDSGLTRQGNGVPEYAFDPSGIMSVQFQFTAGYAFDIWVDDLAFVP